MLRLDCQDVQMLDRVDNAKAGFGCRMNNAHKGGYDVFTENIHEKGHHCL